MGKRGFKGKGYSLKHINGHLYCYVWHEWDHETTKDIRKKGSKNYSRSHGWSSIGNWNKPATHEKLREFLFFKYGHNETELEEIMQKIKQDIQIFSEKKKS